MIDEFRNFAYRNIQPNHPAISLIMRTVEVLCECFLRCCFFFWAKTSVIFVYSSNRQAFDGVFFPSTLVRISQRHEHT